MRLFQVHRAVVDLQRALVAKGLQALHTLHSSLARLLTAVLKFSYIITTAVDRMRIPVLDAAALSDLADRGQQRRALLTWRRPCRISAPANLDARRYWIGRCAGFRKRSSLHLEQSTAHYLKLESNLITASDAYAVDPMQVRVSL